MREPVPRRPSLLPCWERWPVDRGDCAQCWLGRRRTAGHRCAADRRRTAAVLLGVLLATGIVASFKGFATAQRGVGCDHRLRTGLERDCCATAGTTAGAAEAGGRSGRRCGGFRLHPHDYLVGRRFDLIGAGAAQVDHHARHRRRGLEPAHANLPHIFGIHRDGLSYGGLHHGIVEIQHHAIGIRQKIWVRRAGPVHNDVERSPARAAQLTFRMTVGVSSLRFLLVLGRRRRSIHHGSRL